MFTEPFTIGIGELLLQIPKISFLFIFLFFLVGVIITSSVFHFHIKKYAFPTYKIGMVRLVYLAGSTVLLVIALVLLGFIFLQS